jgi:hypothetical protein
MLFAFMQYLAFSGFQYVASTLLSILAHALFHLMQGSFSILRQEATRLWRWHKSHV